MLRVLPLLVAALITGCSRAPQTPAAQRPSPYTSEFWKTWGDGQAEMNGYDLTHPRYGQLRKGVAVAIFVTETFSNTARVKADPGKHPPADEFPVMKLNLVRDYQTGVYDYNEMLSAFIALEPVNGREFGQPTKVSFSSQEWCGHVYGQLLFGNLRAQQVSHSYFDGEADQSREIKLEAATTSEDALMLWARGISHPFMKRGTTENVSVLSSLATSRAKHEQIQLTSAELAIENETQQVQVPAGVFEVEVRTAKLTGGVTQRYYVETGAPRRLVKWETSTGELAVLLGSDRMKYWEMNKEGGEHALKRLGLPVPGTRHPEPREASKAKP
jgi:hypothetical protein